MTKEQVVEKLNKIVDAALENLETRDLEELSALQVAKLIDHCLKLKSQVKKRQKSQGDDLDTLWDEVISDMRNEKRRNNDDNND